MTTLALADDRLAIRVQRLTGGVSRWLSILSESFSVRSVAAVALLRAGPDPEEGWLGRLAALSRDCAAVLSLDLPRPAALADFVAGALRADIARCGPRFAMIIDSDARCRRTLRYRAPDDLPSPLLGWAVALRKRDRTQERLGERFAPIGCRRTRRAPARRNTFVIIENR